MALPQIRINKELYEDLKELAENDVRFRGKLSVTKYVEFLLEEAIDNARLLFDE